MSSIDYQDTYDIILDCREETSGSALILRELDPRISNLSLNGGKHFMTEHDIPDHDPKMYVGQARLASDFSDFRASEILTTGSLDRPRGVTSGSKMTNPSLCCQDGSKVSPFNNEVCSADQPQRRVSGCSIDRISATPSDFSYESNTSTTNVLLPPTPDPNTVNCQRTIGRNPVLVPIPHQYRFRLDYCQMKDLETIRNGGNGCARSGNEFNVEEEYELGGGGAMGCWPSAAAADADEVAECYPCSIAEENNALLDELPRSSL